MEVEQRMGEKGMEKEKNRAGVKRREGKKKEEEGFPFHFPILYNSGVYVFLWTNIMLGKKNY